MSIVSEAELLALNLDYHLWQIYRKAPF